MSNAKVILANADIFFDATLNLLDGYDFTNKFFALTRYDLLLDGSIQKMKTICFVLYTKNHGYQKKHILWE
jgi:hypothetical protein